MEGKVIAAAGADNSIKLYDLASTQIVGGGSLKKRLDGANLTCMEADPGSSRLFLGTNNHSVMVYHINSSTFEPNHVYTLTLSESQSVSSLMFSHGNIFAGCGPQVFVYNVGVSASEPKSVSSPVLPHVVCRILRLRQERWDLPAR